MIHEFVREDTLHTVEISGRGGRRTARLGEKTVEVAVHAASPNRLSLFVGSRSYSAAVVRADDRLFVHVDGEPYCFTLPGPSEDACGAVGSAGEDAYTVKAPMPGSVLKICVNEGDPVEEGQCLAIVEAMKMETELRAAVGGVVKSIRAEAGTQVEAGELLIELGETEGPPE